MRAFFRFKPLKSLGHIGVMSGHAISTGGMSNACKLADPIELLSRFAPHPAEPVNDFETLPIAIY